MSVAAPGDKLTPVRRSWAAGRQRPLRVADVTMFYGERSGGIRTTRRSTTRCSVACAMTASATGGWSSATGGWDTTPRAIVQRYDEHVEDVLVNVLYALALRALSRLDTEDGAKWSERARRTEAALLERCYDDRTGLFFDLAGRGERPVTVSTWSALAPLALRGLPEAVRRRIVEEHLLDRRRYLAQCGIPSVSLGEPTFNPNFSLWRCWRGPSWVNIAWLLVPAMHELGYRAEAKRVVRSLELAADRHGYREYYNPLTGRGLGARGFGSSTPLIDLLAECGLGAVTPSGGSRMMQP
jgi:glycogen debranching enzyme